jgi:hypothetical protein
MSLTHPAQDPRTPDSQGDNAAPQAPELHALFPGGSDDELNQVDEFLNGYYAVVLRVYQRLKQENSEIIDELMKNRRMKGKVDSLK